MKRHPMVCNVVNLGFPIFYGKKSAKNGVLLNNNTST